MVPTLQHNHQHHRRRELERVLLVVGFVCIAIFLVVNVVLYFIVDTLEESEGDIQFGSVYVSEPAQQDFYNPRRRIKAPRKKRHGGRQHRHRHINNENRPGDEDPRALGHLIEDMRVPEPLSHSSLPYDIHDCPSRPPRHYPFAWDAVDVLSHWNVDSTAIPSVIHQALCVFDWVEDYDTIQVYRKLEVPFVLRNHPQVQATVARWNTPGYLEDLIGEEPQRNEHSVNNHLMFWRLRQGPAGDWFRRLNPDYEPPTSKAELTVSEWMEKAELMDNMPDEEQINEEHFYFRFNADEGNNEYMYDELPFFGVNPQGDFMVDPEQQRGINCRLGMKGSVAEAHFDPTRNFIVVLRGQRRYVLAHPSQCPALKLYPPKHPSGRHSSVHWGTEYEELAGAQLNEVLLQPGDVLYLPTSWFHFIVSLNTNYQCNARSGMTMENVAAIELCGFHVPKG